MKYTKGAKVESFRLLPLAVSLIPSHALWFHFQLLLESCSLRVKGFLMNEVVILKSNTCTALPGHIASLPLLCRARERPAQRRTETRCGMLGVHGVSVPVAVEEALRTPSGDASAPGKVFSVALGYIKACTRTCNSVARR